MAARAWFLLTSISFASNIPLDLCSSVSLDFRMTPSTIQPLVTTDVSLTCTVNEQSYNYRRSTIDSSVARIRILKNFEDGWKPIAQISDLNPHVTLASNFNVFEAEGAISRHYTKKSFIRLAWDVASSSVFGSYRCHVVHFDQQQNALLTKSSELAIGQTLNALNLLLVITHENDKLMEHVTFQKFQQEKYMNHTQSFLSNMSATETILMDTVQKLERTIESQGKMILQMQEKFNTTIIDTEDGLNMRLNDINSQVRLLIDSGFLMLWPQGSYGLLMPKSGCPAGRTFNWKTGWRRHHTESTDRNEDKLSKENHMFEPSISRGSGNNFMTQHFCIQGEVNTVGPAWPKGSYCVNKKGDCPASFQRGYMKWDEENSYSSTKFDGELPDGRFNQSTSTINYCCRNDGLADTYIYLPSSAPFYLYRFGGQCQNVHGMNVTEEYVEFDTENDDNQDGFHNIHPDGTINNIRLELCYYQKI